MGNASPNPPSRLTPLLPCNFGGNGTVFWSYLAPFSRRIHDRSGHPIHPVDIRDSGNLRHRAIDQAKVAAVDGQQQGAKSSENMSHLVMKFHFRPRNSCYA